MTVGGKTTLDKLIKKNFEGHFLQYNQDKVFENNNYYLTVIGDYIAESCFNPKISEKIDKIFDSNNAINETVIKDLQQILELKIKTKIKISRNKKRAEKIKRKLGRNFYIISKTNNL